ncbi:unnamed protein product, partial [Symbiodinium sp. KB8]
MAQEMGYSADFAFDIVYNGWDALKAGDRSSLLNFILATRPRLTILSPPCTMFSDLMLWNASKMDPNVYQQRMTGAVIMFEYALDLCMHLHEAKLSFALEHPCSASSWKLEKFRACVEKVGTKMALFSFDQCSLGLLSPDGQRKLKKKTRIFSNADCVARELSLCKCTCAPEEHLKIRGSQHGVRVSRFAQVYPPEFCRKL